MERLTIPDVIVDENTTRRTIIDASEVRKHAMEFYWRLKSVEDILGDDYDLDRLKVLVNQRMTMREEVAERFSITKDIPVEILLEMVNSQHWMSPVCVGCPGKTEDGRRTEKCGYPDDQKLCEEMQKRLFELAEADREGRCVVLPCKVGTIVYSVRHERVPDDDYGMGSHIERSVVSQKFRLIHADCIGKTVFLTSESAERALKGEANEHNPV